MCGETEPLVCASDVHYLYMAVTVAFTVTGVVVAATLLAAVPGLCFARTCPLSQHQLPACGDRRGPRGVDACRSCRAARETFRTDPSETSVNLPRCTYGGHERTSIIKGTHTRAGIGTCTETGTTSKWTHVHHSSKAGHAVVAQQQRGVLDHEVKVYWRLDAAIEFYNIFLVIVPSPKENRERKREVCI